MENDTQRVKAVGLFPNTSTLEIMLYLVKPFKTTEEFSQYLAEKGLPTSEINGTMSTWGQYILYSDKIRASFVHSETYTQKERERDREDEKRLITPTPWIYDGIVGH